MTNEQIDLLREQVSERLPEKRMAHVLRVEEQIVWLGEMLLPGELPRLRVAALLHDVAKDVPDAEQEALCDRLGIPLTDEERKTPSVIHAKSGAFIAKRDFPHLVDDGILYAIEHHTVGTVNMPLFAKLLMLADFTESGRAWDRCQESRRYLAKMAEMPTEAEKMHYFNDAFYYALHLKYQYIATVTEGLDQNTKDMLAFYKSLSSFA